MQPILETCALFTHNCKLVQDFLETETVDSLPNPPYLPALSPCDFFLLTLLKNNFSRCLYEHQSALSSVIVLCVHGLPQKVYISLLRA